MPKRYAGSPDTQMCCPQNSYTYPSIHVTTRNAVGSMPLLGKQCCYPFVEGFCFLPQQTGCTTDVGSKMPPLLKTQFLVVLLLHPFLTRDGLLRGGCTVSRLVCVHDADINHTTCLLLVQSRYEEIAAVKPVAIFVRRSGRIVCGGGGGDP